jgi:hypothetical protein
LSGTDTSRQPQRRRTDRIRVHAPLFVYGYPGDNPFHEDTYTVEISAHGGLISMETAVRPGHVDLVLTNHIPPLAVTGVPGLGALLNPTEQEVTVK